MFEDVSGLIADNRPGLHSGVAVVDLGAARLALFVTGFDGPNRLLVWSGGGVADMASPQLADRSGRAIAAAAGDLDGDGREELYVLNTDTFAGPRRTADRLFQQHASGHWEDLFERPENTAARNLAAGRSVGVIDRRGVGRYSFFVANYGRPMRLYELAPGGQLVDLAPALDLARITGGRGVLMLPVLSSWPDIFCVNEQGPNWAFRNRGDGTFEEVAAELGLADAAESARGVTAFDAGGTFGLCWGNWDGPHRLMVRGPHGRFCDRATPGFAFPSAVRTVIAADFDNDGNDELFLNHLGEPNRLYRLVHEPGKRQPPGSTADIAERDQARAAVDWPVPVQLDAGDALDATGYGTGAAIADIDGDGVLELLVARGEKAPQPLMMFKARSPYRNWLRIYPLTRFSAPARGAVVQAEYGDRRCVKGICGGSGYLGQMEPVAHFGLGEATTVERVTVTWPDGAAVVLRNLGSNTTVTVPYPWG